MDYDYEHGNNYYEDIINSLSHNQRRLNVPNLYIERRLSRNNISFPRDVPRRPSTPTPNTRQRQQYQQYKQYEQY